MNNTVKNTPTEILDVLNKSNNILTIVDASFDYDSLCSTLIFKKILETLGKNLTAIRQQKLPDKAKSFLPASQFIQDTTNLNKFDFTKYDLLVLLDTANPTRLNKEGDFKLPANIKTLKIDHHQEPTESDTCEVWKGYSYTKPDKAANTLVMYELIKAWNIKFDEELAMYVLVGLVTDSGFFQYDKVRADDLRIAAECLDLGLDISKISWQLNFNKSIESFKLQAILLSRLTVNNEQKYAYSYYTEKDLVENSIDPTNIEFSPSDVIKRLEGVKFVFVVKERIKGVYGISLRSHDSDFNVADLAKKFENGGGHPMAAAGSISNCASVEEAVERAKVIIEG